MILTTEQISHLRAEKRRIESQLSTYAKYVDSREIEFCDSNVCKTIGDSLTEEQYQRNLKEYEKVMEILSTAEYQTTRPTDKIGIGTKFVIKFDYYDKTKTVILTDYTPGISNFTGLVSKNSPLGENVIGKKVDEEFAYTVVLGNERADQRKITGTIVDIKSDPKEYLHYIREKNKTLRMSKPAKRQLRDLKISPNPEAQDEYQRRQEITSSQKELLLLEIKRLLMHGHTASDKSRLAIARKELKTLKLAAPPPAGIIDIGSRFQITISSDGENIETREYEMINCAVSDELENEYIERISSLGNTLYGLRKDDTFSFRENGTRYKGVVTNISVPKQVSDSLFCSHQKKKN